MKNTLLTGILFLVLSFFTFSCSSNCSGECCSGADGTVIACSLSNSDLAKRKAEIQSEVFSKITHKEEIERGYLLYFENTPKTLDSIKKFIKAEQKCCPFFEFNLKQNPDNQTIELKIEAPKKGQAFLRELITELS